MESSRCNTNGDLGVDEGALGGGRGVTGESVFRKVHEIS